MPIHPSPEIPQAVVDKVYAGRGRLFAYDTADPAATAVVVIDFDRGSVGREPELCAAAVENVNRLTSAVRAGGGVVAFVTSAIGDPESLARRIGSAAAARYTAETQPGGVGSQLADAMEIEAGDLHVTKLGASAFFPGKCDLPDLLSDRGVRSVLVTGLMTNICCESSGRDAYELGFEVTMISDALVGQSFGLHEASLATFFRFFGDVRPTVDALAWLGDGRMGDA
jgi:nicotinamidase-related amidase